jgi:hypothetical protein
MGYLASYFLAVKHVPKLENNLYNYWPPQLWTAEIWSAEFITVFDFLGTVTGERCAQSR